MPNLESLKVNLILDRFAQANLRPSNLISGLRDKKKNYLNNLEKAISTIKDYVNNSLHPLLEEIIVPEMWSILEICFWYISPMSILAIFSNKYTRKLVEFKNIIDYTGSYQATYNKVASLVKPESRI